MGTQRLGAGDYTRFCDWSFIHRACLGCLQLNATIRFGKQNPRCRKCDYATETIPHVLNHCKPHSDAWKKRHDAIQNRVARAIPTSVGSVTQKQEISTRKFCIRSQLAVGRSICPDKFLSICVSSFVNEKCRVFKAIAFRSQPAKSDRSSKILIYEDNI
ncbi:uncharacterized protein NPIL_678641 [Nephila pilipes]|uniref:Uncharacterized protein n=1 Tax=Nephila pilipes TaxID=299642 RepID=A0A8X6I8M9_NEPPI|nr:uncharacterized protein NPIL_678641 [Nephila pilipes]